MLQMSYITVIMDSVVPEYDIMANVLSAKIYKLHGWKRVRLQ